FVQSIMYPPYVGEYRTFTFVVEKDIEYTTGLGQWLKTRWSQFNGYNQSFPLTSDNITGHIPVGCGPIAVGQLMYAYQYPSYYNWSAMTIFGTGNKVTSDFLLDVKNKCKAEYNHNEDDPGKSGTGCYQKDMVEALRGYGYRCDDNQKINFVQMLNNPSILVSNLYNPDTDIPDCHAWIVEGGRSTVTNMQTEIWAFAHEYSFDCVYSETLEDKFSNWVFYVNWGWGRAPNAYYDLEPMLPKGYNYNRNVILSGIQNIRPI
ncbi:MAG: C10 family peptidase, partial [Muribaculaceae bacterium]|nr:C10 family peptidase [Muribaculaceae bacterium]